MYGKYPKAPSDEINEIGIFDRTLKQGILKWEQIIEAYPLDIQNQKVVYRLSWHSLLLNYYW